jgi:hypothetical protein
MPRMEIQDAMTTNKKRDKNSGAELEMRGNKRVFDDAALADITDLQSALDALANAGATVDNFNEYGNGFSILRDKAQLSGKPFVVLEWRFNTGTFGEFASALIVTEDGTKCVLNDGSTGIFTQLRMVTDSRERNDVANTQSGLLVKNGLRVSEYTYSDEKGNEIPARTWYLAD